MSQLSPEPDVLYECVPNFSCSRGDPVFPKLQQVAEASGARVLDVHSDNSYNRTVLTLLGSPSQTICAALQLVELSARYIDMTSHRGIHPRLGATDVFPFVPFPGTALSRCIDDVKKVAQKIAEELDLCVYLYGEAAIRPERRWLNHIRRGEFEGWYKEIGRETVREPDFGRAVARRCGPVILGVRQLLIAVNFVLHNADITLAKDISKNVRSKTRGLPAIQARGFLINGLPHVSCNILDFRLTSPMEVFERIDVLCQKVGAAVQETEIVGMIPRAALAPREREKMRVKDWQDTKYLDFGPQVASQNQ